MWNGRAEVKPTEAIWKGSLKTKQNHCTWDQKNYFLREHENNHRFNNLQCSILICEAISITVLEKIFKVVAHSNSNHSSHRKQLNKQYRRHIVIFKLV